jgi:bla regulator protein BlaR1
MTTVPFRRPSLMRKLCPSAIVATTIWVGGFGIIGALPVSSQVLHATAPLPSFEVASIKPQPPLTFTMHAPAGGEKVVSQMVFTGPSGKPQAPTDRVSLHVTPAMLIAMAYNLQLPSEGRIVGGPDWLKTDNYDIQAKIPDALFAEMQKMPPAKSREQRLLMEQSLLAARFHLKAHFETRDMPVYALVAAKGGPKLTPAKDGEQENISVSGDAGGSELKASAARLDDLVRLLQMQPDLSGRMPINQTGLAGTYDFALKWSREQTSGPDNGAPASDAPSFFTALQEQLGLRLVPTKAPVEVVVIDHIEHPTEN